MIALAPITFFFKRLFFALVDNYKIVLCVVVPLLILILFYKACERAPKLDEKQVQEAQKAIAENDRKKMTDILAESDLKEKQIDANLANAGVEKLRTLQQAREKRSGFSNEELAAELERRARE